MPARPTRTALAALALAAGTLLAACGSDGGSDASRDATTTTVAEPTTGEVKTTTADATTTTGDETATTLTSEGRDTETSELDTLPDGTHHGYMAGLEDGMVEGQDVQVIIWDEVELFTGQEAVDAAHEDGAIPADQDVVENDYYIRNQNQRVRRLAVVPDAQVYTLANDGGSTDTIPSSVTEVAMQPFLFRIEVGNVRGITTVSSIEAVFLP
ncbi:MAG TPA: hypothetical protein P5254_05050 [Aquihabitans sp.]|nr:hypothetical protein [Aquihabitans sp.]